MNHLHQEVVHPLQLLHHAQRQPVLAPARLCFLPLALPNPRFDELRAAKRPGANGCILSITSHFNPHRIHGESVLAPSSRRTHREFLFAARRRVFLVDLENDVVYAVATMASRPLLLLALRRVRLEHRRAATAAVVRRRLRGGHRVAVKQAAVEGVQHGWGFLRGGVGRCGVMRRASGRLSFVETEGGERDGAHGGGERGLGCGGLAEKVLLLADGDDVVRRDEEGGRLAPVRQNVVQVIASAGDFGKESLDGNAIEDLEVRQPVVEEIHQIATVLLVPHNHRVVGEIEGFQRLRIKRRAEKNGKREDVLECVVRNVVVREGENTKTTELVQVLLHEQDARRIHEGTCTPHCCPEPIQRVDEGK